MRCKNCGWPNRPGETTCQKCHAPLEDERNYEESNGYTQQARMKTIPEQDAFGDYNASDRACPKCGYPLRSESHVCPNCKYEIESFYNETKEHQHRLTRVDNKDTVSGTINPYLESPAPEPAFILHPIKRVNEKKDMDDIKYVGKDIVLTRSNTEEDNASITSQEQATLSYVEGKWFIENKSAQGTTFIRVSRKTELQDGDTLLLGNRMFEFHKSAE